MQTKYIFITGGVVSGLGKGITSASLGRLLKARGLRVTNQKFDPYINIDPGTMSPYQHGEVFVTEDGAETDLDIGHYERFVDENLSVHSNITAGKIYWSVLNREREGYYLGETIQVIPHITDMIKEKIVETGTSSGSDIVITEIGGTVGDIEGLPFLEAIRQISIEVGRENVLYVHVTLIPYLSLGGEMKTKPTQHSVKQLLSIGIQPDILVCRTEKKMSRDMKEKLALFCNVSKKCVIQNTDADSLYEVPLLLEDENFAELVCERLSIPKKQPDLTEWQKIVKMQKDITKKITVALVGKYVELHDAYLSIIEALNHAGIHNSSSVEIEWVSAESVEKGDAYAILKNADAILVPGGFGERGIEGKIKAIRFAREHKVPLLGICLGMQMLVVEYAQNVAKLDSCHSSEFYPDYKNPVIDLIYEQKGVVNKGGTMRLGAYPCVIKKGTLLEKLYACDTISERHRHRYEVNINYSDKLVNSGLIFSGMSPDGMLTEAVELPQNVHPWFIGVQFHPEFKSRPNRPHPIFMGLVKAGIDKKFGSN